MSIRDEGERRTEILYGLWAVIHERGIEGVTYQSVAAEAGVSIGRVQHYFATKDELVRAGAQALIATSEGVHRSRSESLAPRDALIALLTGPLPRTPQFRLGAAVWHAYLTRAMVDEGVAEVVREAVAGTQNEVVRLLGAALAEAGDKAGSGAGSVAGSGARTGVGSGVPSKATLRREALHLLALSDGLTQRVLLGVTDVGDAEATVEAAVDRAMGLAGEDGRRD